MKLKTAGKVIAAAVLLAAVAAGVLSLRYFNSFRQFQGTDHWGGAVELEVPGLCWSYRTPERSFLTFRSLADFADFYAERGLDTTLFQPQWGSHSLLLQWEDGDGGRTPYLLREVPEGGGRLQFSDLGGWLSGGEGEKEEILVLIPWHLLTTRQPLADYPSAALTYGEPCRTDLELEDFAAFYESTGRTPVERGEDTLTVTDGDARFTLLFEEGEHYPTVTFLPA